jgi:2-(1,2-epoxy-1,2-dihydrophenyl)acetyl-CoA isomerase
VDPLTRSVEDSIAYVSFNRPQSRQSIDEASGRALLAFLDEADADPSLRAVVVGGAGPFCSGVDLRVLDDIGEGRKWPDLGGLIADIFNPLVRKLRDLSKPTIAAIDGVAAGAGLSVALACDFRFGTQRAKFVPAFSRLGLIPDSGGTWLLARMVGPAKALEIAAFSAPIDAGAARSLGLLTWLSESGEFGAELGHRAREVAALPRLAVLEMRALFGEAPSVTFPQALESELAAMRTLGKTADHAEGLRAFKEKRTPCFSN